MSKVKKEKMMRYAIDLRSRPEKESLEKLKIIKQELRKKFFKAGIRRDQWEIRENTAIFLYWLEVYLTPKAKEKFHKKGQDWL